MIRQFGDIDAIAMWLDDHVTQLMEDVMSIALDVFRGFIVIAYGFGAATHVGNLVGRGPTPPPGREVLWRRLDVVYLALDLTVVVGVVLGAAWGYAAFFAAAASQLVLYLGFPDSFASTRDEHRQIRGLVHFHLATAAAMTTLLIAS